MIVRTLVASRGQLQPDGTVLVVWDLPGPDPLTHAPLSYIGFIQSRYLTKSTDPIGSILRGTVPPDVRLQVPGAGASAPDLSIPQEDIDANVFAILRGNGEREVLSRINLHVDPNQPNGAPWPQLSLRYPRFADQPSDATAGLTQAQILQVGYG